MAEMQTEGDWHWRNSMKTVRFFGLDSRVALFLLVFIIHMRTWTFGLFVFVCLLFWFLERKGLTFDSAFRSARTWILGSNRPAWLWIRRRRMVDYGR